jgi:hypothetical protein
MALLRRGVPLLKRGFASEVSVADSPFLRFGNPAPTSLDLTPLLSSVPETEVGSLLTRRESGGAKPSSSLSLPLSPLLLSRSTTEEEGVWASTSRRRPSASGARATDRAEPA